MTVIARCICGDSFNVDLESSRHVGCAFESSAPPPPSDRETSPLPPPWDVSTWPPPPGSDEALGIARINEALAELKAEDEECYRHYEDLARAIDDVDRACSEAEGIITYPTI